MGEVEGKDRKEGHIGLEQTGKGKDLEMQEVKWIFK